MTPPSQRLVELGIELPEPAAPAFNYVSAVISNGLMIVSGQLPKEDGEVRIVGKLGDDVDIDGGRNAARICTLQGLAAAAAAVGGIDAIQRVLRCAGYVASASGFHDQPKVIDAASDLLTSVFGDAGKHARVAVGVAELPRNASVEIEFMFAV